MAFVLQRKYFSAYKRRHPKQMVLIHFNGLSHDLRFVPDSFKAVHWLHHNGCKLAGNLSVHAGADMMSRRFENGLVLVNPSDAPFIFELKKLYPDFRGQRLGGKVVGTTVEVPPRDGLFFKLLSWKHSSIGVEPR